MRSVTAGPLPLYGTCSMSTLAIEANSSPARWIEVPLPAEANVTLPGWALAWAITSATVLAFDWATLVTSTLGTTASSETGAKFFSGS